MFIYKVLEGILQTPIQEYMSYAFQILAQVLILHPSPPLLYQSMLPVVLSTSTWTNSLLPALTQLLCAYTQRMPNTSTLETLSIIQKLIGKNESHAMLLLSTLFEHA